jgi:hypothetical protein
MLCVLGAILPILHLIQFLWAYGFDLAAFHGLMFANDIAGFFAWDVIVSSLVLWTLVAVEGRRTGTRHLWAPIAANLVVGVSLGLPLFLYLRERQLERAPSTAGA